MGVFTIVQASTNLRRHACISYNWVTDLLEILKNDSKNAKSTLIIVFEIKIDIRSFIVRVTDYKWEKAIRRTSKALIEESVPFLDIQLLIRFLFFYS